jgi:hypothetical protein
MKSGYIATIIAALLLTPATRAAAQGTTPESEAQRAAATHLVSGAWTGTLTPPGGTEVPVEYTVVTSTDSASITISAMDNRLPASSVRFENGTLRFSFNPGEPVNCTLTPQTGGGFSGSCVDSSGGTGKLVMTPPKKS